MTGSCRVSCLNDSGARAFAPSKPPRSPVWLLSRDRRTRPRGVGGRTDDWCVDPTVINATWLDSEDGIPGPHRAHKPGPTVGVRDPGVSTVGTISISWLAADPRQESLTPKGEPPMVRGSRGNKCCSFRSGHRIRRAPRLRLSSPISPVWLIFHFQPCKHKKLYYYYNLWLH